MKVSRFFRGALPAIAGGLVLAGILSSPAEAQFSKSYKFLESVRKKEGQEVTDALAEPGTTIVNTRDSTTGETALHIVTARRDATWMRFLIGKGADVNARDNKGVTPLQLATNLGFVEGVDILVSDGARVDDPDATGETALISAVHRHDIDMMRVLLKGGANPDRSDSTGRSARDYAKTEDRGGTLTAEINANAKARGKRSSDTYGPSLQ